jgi:hypothetical protein
MSAVDFAANEDEVMNVAKFMATFGLEQRALELFQEVAKVQPGRPEPYMFGLELARRTKDIKGVHWACHGILSQAWSRENVHVAEKAFNIAKTTLAELKKANRAEEAAQFEQTVGAALQRDCVVQVTWTGDADIDVAVQEPSGDVCSLRNPRSTGGGLMWGDGYSRPDQSAVDGYKEMYVCPQAFTGEYKLLIRRVWGDVAAGKVTVDVITNYGTPDERRIRQQIPLAEKDALVVFEVPKGRRVEHLAQAALDNLRDDQEQVGQVLVAKQLKQIEQLRDNQQTGSMSSIDYELWRRYFGMNRAAGLSRRGAAGFMPVITTLPEGTMLSIATAVVSGDRLYVRISIPPIPIFTGIGDVATFNFVTGQQGGQTGGGGGTPGGGPGGGAGGGGFF